MLDKLFMSAIEISLWLSVVIVVLKITSPLIKKTYAAKWRYIIWLILAIRLAVPLNITLPFTPVKLTVPDNTIIFGQASNANDIVEPISNMLSVIEIAAIVWLIGICIFALYQFTAYRSFRKKMKRWSIPVTDGEILSLFDYICHELNIKKKPDIKISKTAGSPMMLGFIKPVLYLQNIEYINHRNLEVIIKHELVHYKRRDLWYKLILLTANAVHWFNPLVYIMMKTANDDIEFSCDDEVTKNADIVFKKIYSQVILDSVRKEKSYTRALTTQFKSGKKTMKNRFANILDTTKKRKGKTMLLLVIGLIIISSMLVSFTNEIPINSPDEINLETNDYIDGNVAPVENNNEKLIAAQIDGKWTILEIP